MTAVPPARHALPAARPLPALRRALPVVVALGLLVSTGCDGTRDDTRVPEPWPTPTALTWQWQLSGAPDLSIDADVFELDAFTTPAHAVERLRSRGRRLICYLNAGVYEQSRPDADRFPPELLGAPTGTPGQRWLDIRQWQDLKPVLLDRLRLCRGKGFHAVDLDNVDGYAHVTGFDLTPDDQLRFNRRIAALARSVGLSPGLKNDVDQAVALEPDFDFAINEGCYFWGVCRRLVPFVEAGKPVFHVEYDVPTADFCGTTRRLGFASIRKDRQLGAWRVACLR